jgi:hypothetical protein
MVTKHKDEHQFLGGITQGSGSYSQESVATGISAAGTTIADATQLAAAMNEVTTVASGTGVKLPVAAVGATIVVQNLGANNLEVYPPNGSGVINGAAAGGAITLAAATDDIGVFRKTATNKWSATVSAGPAT